MPTMEEINEGYFNYLANEILEAVMNADRYNCKDFEVLKLELLINLHKLMDSKKNFDERIKILSLYERK